ncbi:hypothetical protein CAI21_20155 [Alkalilimnicola ehrlichii]|uniref:Uncharacterized protein n=2 Tax=Alkalilimnicola ehrlichii TaxID=351052 RepID=A0A3E0WIJ3_9GAMM|nr:hypothetical protein CAI21_20155 [Alkalilimnicola ehrlichii]RFA32043.1 hypothetical protein CAL65_20610 [Alkalilimnicola ehrlichii]
MRGTVKLLNRDDGIVGIETEHGEYTVLGLLEDYEIAEGDVISGPLEALDQQLMNNETRQLQMNVYVEDCELQYEDAKVKVG